MRIDQSIQIEIISPSQTKGSAAQPFSGMKAGDTMQAELVGIKGSQVLLKTQDGTIVQAEFQGNAQFQPGDVLHLSFNSRQGGRVSLQMLSINGQSLKFEVSTQENNLLRLGIEPTPLNVKLAQALQQNGYIPTPQNIANLSKLAAAYPSLAETVSTFMAANNVQPDEAAIQQLVQFTSKNQPMLGSRATALVESLSQFSGAPVLAEPLVSTPHTPPAQPTSPSAVQPQPGAAQTAVSQTAQTTQTAATVPDLSMQVLSYLSEKQPQITSSLSGSDGFAKLMQQLPSLSGESAKSAVVSFVSSLPLSKSQAQTLTANITAALQNTLRDIAAMPSQLAGNTAFAQAMDPSNQPANTHIQANVSSPPELATKEESGKTSPLLQTSVNGDDTSISTSFQEATHLMRKISGLFVQLRQNDISSTAKELQMSVANQEKLMESVRSDTLLLAGEKSIVGQQAESLRAQVHLTSNLESFVYFQIPVQFEQRKNTAELYIFERKGGGQADRQSSSILISLDTENMGHIETMLRADQNDLNMDVRLESKQICQYLENNTAELKDSLEESGFRLKDIQFRMLETKTTLLNAEQVFSNENHLHMGGLDIQI